MRLAPQTKQPGPNLAATSKQNANRNLIKMITPIAVIVVMSILLIFRNTKAMSQYNVRDKYDLPQHAVSSDTQSAPVEISNASIGLPDAVSDTHDVLVQNRDDTVKLIDFDKIPPYIRDYLEWHGQQLQKMNEEADMLSRKNATDEELDEHLGKYRFLVLRCVGGSNDDGRKFNEFKDRCGGTSDRIRSFPLFIWYAATSNRILFFRWSRPAPLEAFMMPGSTWNWTVPDAVSRKIDQFESHTAGDKQFSRWYFDGRSAKKLQGRIRKKDAWMVEGNDYSGGSEMYTKLVSGAMNATEDWTKSGLFSKLRPEDAHYENFYHDLFHATFRPSPGVGEILDSYFYDPKNDETSSPSRLRLPVPMKRNRYAVAHYRAQYPREPYLRSKKNQTVLKETAIHAVECTKSRAGSTTSSTGASAVYLMSDTGLALQAIHENYRSYNLKSLNSTNKIPVWTSLDLQTEDSPPNLTGTIVEDPQHLNFGNPDDHSGFYSTFVDLFLMSYANCVLHGAGGFGRMGILMSHRPSCGMMWRTNKYPNWDQNCSAYEG